MQIYLSNGRLEEICDRCEREQGFPFIAAVEPLSKAVTSKQVQQSCWLSDRVFVEAAPYLIQTFAGKTKLKVISSQHSFLHLLSATV